MISSGYINPPSLTNRKGFGSLYPEPPCKQQGGFFGYALKENPRQNVRRKGDGTKRPKDTKNNYTVAADSGEAAIRDEKCGVR